MDDIVTEYDSPADGEMEPTDAAMGGAGGEG